MFTKTHETS